MKHKNPLSLLKFIELIVNARVAYNNVKKDPEAKKTNTDFGKRAIFYTFLFAILSIGGLALLLYGINKAQTSIFFGILLIIIAAYLIIYGLPYVILALNLVIKQLCLNRKFISWLALIIFIVVIGIAVCSVLLILGKADVI